MRISPCSADRCTAAGLDHTYSLQARRDLGHLRLNDKLLSMSAHVSLKEEYLGKKESLFGAEKQKIPKKVWVKAA